MQAGEQTGSTERGKRKSWLRRLLATLVVLIVAIGGVPLAWRYFETGFYEQALPVQLETVGLATMGSDFSLWMALIPMRHKACGGAVFGLSEEVLDKIKKGGLQFFQTARQGRGYPEGHPDRHYYNYAEWRETPATENMEKNSAWLGFDCIGIDKRTRTEIGAAASQPGSFFTTKREAVLLVIPKLGIAVLSYFG